MSTPLKQYTDHFSRVQGLKKEMLPVLHNRRNSASNLRPASPSPKIGVLSRSPVLNERFSKYRSSTASSNIDKGPPKPVQNLNQTAYETNSACEELTRSDLITENSNTESERENSPRFYTEDTKTLLSKKSESDCIVLDPEDELTQPVIYLGYLDAQNQDHMNTHSIKHTQVLSDQTPQDIKSALYIDLHTQFPQTKQPKPFKEISSSIITEFIPIKKPAIHILSQKQILNCSKYPPVPKFKHLNLEDLPKAYQLSDLSDSSNVPYSQITDDKLSTTTELYRTHEEKLLQSNIFDYSDSQSSIDYMESSRFIDKNSIVKGDVLSFTANRNPRTVNTVEKSLCINLEHTDEKTTENPQNSLFLLNTWICTEIKNGLSFDEFMSEISPKNVISKHNLSFTSNIMNKTTASKLTKQLSKDQPKSQRLDINKIKQVALEKERNLKIRKEAVIRLQTLIRGFLAKQKFKRLISEHKEKICFYKLNRITYRIKQSFARPRIVKACTKYILYQRHVKAILFERFLSHCAMFIQKFWRGFRIRQLYKHIFKQRKDAKKVILSLLQAWKTRKVMESKPVKAQKAYIKDMELIFTDAASNSSETSTNELKRRIGEQLPAMKLKYINQFYEHYKAGSWISKNSSVLSTTKSLYKSYKDISNLSSKPSLRELPGFLRDEVPIKPLNKGYEEPVLEINDEDSTPIEAPKKKFTNFLKRNNTQKYNPRQCAKQNKYDPKKFKNFKSSINNDIEPEETQEIEQEETQYKFDLQESTFKTPTKIQEDEDSFNHYTEEPTKTHQPICSFLKRRSQAVKAQKLNWNVPSRIKCWTAKDSPQDFTPIKERPIEKPLAPKKKQVQASKKQKSTTKRIILPPAQKIDQLELSKSLFNNIAQSQCLHEPSSGCDYLSVEDLESIFSDMCKRHISSYAYFKTIKRFDSRTKIPQFRPYSTFIKHCLQNS